MRDTASPIGGDRSTPSFHRVPDVLAFLGLDVFFLSLDCVTQKTFRSCSCLSIATFRGRSRNSKRWVRAGHSRHHPDPLSTRHDPRLLFLLPTPEESCLFQPYSPDLHDIESVALGTGLNDHVSRECISSYWLVVAAGVVRWRVSLQTDISGSDHGVGPSHPCYIFIRQPEDSRNAEGFEQAVSVEHQGCPYPTGRPGYPVDSHRRFCSAAALLKTGILLLGSGRKTCPVQPPDGERYESRDTS